MGSDDADVPPLHPPPPPPAPLSPDEQPLFVHRVVRVMALILLAYAALHVVQYVVAVFVQGAWWWGYVGYDLRLIGRAIQLSLVGNTVLLVVGAAGMLGWRRWARPAVMLWTILYVVLHFASYALWVTEYARQLSTVPTTQAVRNQPVWQYMLAFGFSWIADVLFPLLVWLILRQPEVAALFTPPRRGGFEVVPFAQPAATVKTRD